MAGLVTGNARARLRDRKDDLYETPPEAVHGLLAHESLPGHIWEPACGPGAIVRVLRAAGHRVTATDLVDYRSDDQDAARRDFLLEREAPEGVGAIVTNPPFKLAAPFVRRGLALVPKVVLLLRLAFLESESRRDIVDEGRLACVLLFDKRLPMMHRAGWEGRKANSAMAFAWFVWDRDYKGAIVLKRISWEAATKGKDVS